MHHEKIDGSGYPHGLQGQEVPIAARIISVSDVFDALTSARPYKDAWSNPEAFSELDKMAQKNLLDSACVNALRTRRAEVEQIQDLFGEG